MFNLIKHIILSINKTVFVVCIAFLVMLCRQDVFAASSGPLSPSAWSSVAIGGSSSSFTFGNNTYASDASNTNVTATLGGWAYTDYIVLTGFGFAIPAGNSIDGIVVEIDRWNSAGTNLYDNRIRIVKGGVIGATDKSNANVWVTGGDPFTYQTYGGAADVWGETWTDADINNANFGVAISAYKFPGGANARPRINHVRITVYYSPNTRYAILNGGDWNVAGTWSITSGGGSCGCIPDANSYVYIENGYTVDMDADGSAKNLTIYNGGHLRWIADNVELNMYNGGTITVESGGDMNENGRASAAIDFEDAYAVSMIVNDATTGITLDNFNLNANPTLTISGSGKIALSNNFNLTGTSTVTNNFAGTFTIGNRIAYSSTTTGSVFTNNQNNSLFSVTQDLYFNNDNCQFVNNGTVSFGDDFLVNNSTDNNNVLTNNVGATISFGGDFYFNNGNVTVNNYGTLTLTGEFGVAGSGIDGGSNFYNYSGTWYYGGASFDASTTLHCDEGTENTFDYNGASDQSIINPDDNYWHLKLTNSGIKSSTNNLNVDGNLTIDNTASLDVGTGNDDITLEGDWTDNSTAINPFVEGTRTVTFNGAALQTITCLSGTETYHDVRNSNVTNTVRMACHLDIDGDLTLDNGSTLDAATNTKNITLAGNWANSNAVALTGFNPGTALVTFNGTALQSITQSGGTEQFGEVRNSNVTNTVRLVNHIDVNGNLTLDDNSTLDAATNTRNITIAGNWDNNELTASGAFTEGNATVTFNGTALQTIDHAGGTETFNNLRISNTANVVQMVCHLTLMGTLTIDNNATLDAGTNTKNILTYGNWTNNNVVASAGFTEGTATVRFISSGFRTINHAGGTETFYNVRNSTSNTLRMGCHLDIDGDLTLDDNSILDAATNTKNITLAGNWINNELTASGAFSEGTAQVTFNGTALQTISQAGGTETFYHVQNSNTTNIVRMNCHLDIDGNLTLDNGSTLDAATNTKNITIAGNWTNNNAVALTGFSPGTALVTFNGTALQTVSQTGGTEQFYEVRNSNVTNTVRMACHFDINANLTLDDNSTLDAATNTKNITIAGNWDNNELTASGAFTEGTAQVTFNGTALQTIDHAGGTESFYHVQNSNVTNIVRMVCHLDINGNLTLDNGSTLDAATNTRNINIAGNWDNNSAVASAGFTEGTATVTFDGTGEQDIDHAGGTETFYNLINNMSVAFSFIKLNSTDVVVTNSVDFTNAGQFILGAYDFLMGTATLAGYDADEFFVTNGSGYLERNASGSTAYPVGYSQGQYAPATLVPTAASTFQVREDNTVTSPADATRIVNVEWEINTSGAPGATTVTLQWNATTEAGLFDITDPDVVIGRYNGTSWEEKPVTGKTTGSPRDATVTITIFNDFFAVGSGGEGPLPITLLNFYAEPKSKTVELKWTTASEANNDYFTIEKTIDGENYELVATVDGAGNSNTLLTYNTVDESPYDGISYYRLTQTDFDGNHTHSDLVLVEYVSDMGNDITFKIYPNPANVGESVYAEFTGIEAGKIITVVIRDVTGRDITSKAIVTSNNGTAIKAIDPYSKLPSGTYVITGGTATKIYSEKLIIR